MDPNAELFDRLEAIQERTGCRLSAAREALDACGGDVEAAVARLHAPGAGGAVVDAGGAATPPVAGSGDLSAERKLLAVICHIGGLFGFPFLVPLIIFLLSAEAPFVRHHAKQAMAWHIGAAPHRHRHRVDPLLAAGGGDLYHHCGGPGGAGRVVSLSHPRRVG